MANVSDAAAPVAPAPRWRRLAERLPRWTGPAAGIAAGIALLALLAAAVHGELAGLTRADIAAALGRVSAADVALALAATAASYAALAGYELLALRLIGRPVSPGYAATTGFIAYAFTFLLGFGVLTGGAVRLRRYRPKGLSAGQTVSVTLVGAVAFWVGLAAIAGLCLALEPSEVGLLGAGTARAIGIAILVLAGAVLALSVLRPGAVGVGGFGFPVPRPSVAVGVLTLGVLDTAFAALALWLLLPADADIGFLPFLARFAVATVAGVVSHAPGGLGAFEAVILLTLPTVPKGELVAALLTFRIVYYAVPFVLGLVAFVAEEVRAGTLPFPDARRTLARTLAPLLPRIAAFAVFAGGAVLLASGSVPAEAPRIAALARILPLPFVETSHFVASGVGAVLTIVGYGLVRRLRSAWRLAAILLATGAVFSLAKGLDVEEAAVCLAILALLLASRDAFYREGGAFAGAASPRWLAAVGVAVALSVWLGLVAYRHVDYSHDLWWQFAYDADAPRFLRAAVVSAAVVVIAIVWRALHAPGRAEPAPPPADEAIAAALAVADDTAAQLALLGDKRFLLSPLGPGFVMYAVHGSTWLAMGDPVTADAKTRIDLVWRFKELAHRNAGSAAFYEVAAEHLPLYVDAGFSFVKLGEEAVVDLGSFTTEGGAGARHRQALAKAARLGLTFEIVPAAAVPAILPELKAVSDAWIAAQGGREKGFSLGFWDAAYLSRFDCAVVRAEGRAVAFANIWATAGLGSASIDLMRHRPDVPNGTMDFLFVSLLVAMKARGGREFTLGIAPMSGMPDHALAPAWSRIGRLVYEHGSSFYNFRGLREFKGKFKPEWRPRYLAHEGGLSAARALLDATLTISAGPRRRGKEIRVAA